MRCIHPSQRYISARQVTDNIFEVETSAPAHVACAPQESGVSLSLSAKNLQGQHSHTWNLRVQNEDNSLWPEEYDKVVLRVVSFFAMAFEPIFRWLQESIIPKNPDNLEFLQPAQCAYANDLAVASSSLEG